LFSVGVASLDMFLIIFSLEIDVSVPLCVSRGSVVQKRNTKAGASYSSGLYKKGYPWILLVVFQFN